MKSGRIALVIGLIATAVLVVAAIASAQPFPCESAFHDSGRIVFVNGGAARIVRDTYTLTVYGAPVRIVPGTLGVVLDFGERPGYFAAVCWETGLREPTRAFPGFYTPLGVYEANVPLSIIHNLSIIAE